MTFMNRWESFKIRKEAIVNANICARRKMESSMVLLILMNADAFVRKLWERYDRYKRELYAHNKMVFILKIHLVTFLAKRFKRGRDLETRLHRQLRSTITFHARVLHSLHAPYMKAHVILHFMIEQDFRKSLARKFGRTRELILLIQGKFRNSIDINEAKLKLLQRMWDKEASDLLTLTTTGAGRANKSLKDLGRRVAMIDKTIVQACLRMYLNACIKRHAIAFFQWR